MNSNSRVISESLYQNNKSGREDKIKNLLILEIESRRTSFLHRTSKKRSFFCSRKKITFFHDFDFLDLNESVSLSAMTNDGVSVI